MATLLADCLQFTSTVILSYSDSKKEFCLDFWSIKSSPCIVKHAIGVVWCVNTVYCLCSFKSFKTFEFLGCWDLVLVV